MKAGPDICGMMTAALRKLGFDRVFDTAFSADLTIMEEASELVHRVQNGGKLPMFTSCSPGWIKFVEQFYPGHSSQRVHLQEPAADDGRGDQELSPPAENIDPAISSAWRSCPARPRSSKRPPGDGARGRPDIDAVLTTRELARLLRMYGIEMQQAGARIGRYAVRRPAAPPGSSSAPAAA
jgi:NADP-reducing hydrogenase subunit HndD